MLIHVRCNFDKCESIDFDDRDLNFNLIVKYCAIHYQSVSWTTAKCKSVEKHMYLEQ